MVPRKYGSVFLDLYLSLLLLGMGVLFLLAAIQVLSLGPT